MFVEWNGSIYLTKFDLEATLKGSGGHARELEQAAAGLCCLVLSFFVVDDLFDAGLDEDFGAFVTGKEGGIASRLLRVEIAIEDGVDFGVYDVGVLGVGKGALARPRELIIRTSAGKAVVANADNFVLVIDEGGADFG